MGLGARGVSWGFGDGVVSHDAGLNSGVASLTWQDPYDGVHAMFAKGVFYKKIPLKPSEFSTFNNMFTYTGGNQSMYMNKSGFLVQSQTNIPMLEFTSQTVGTNFLLSSSAFGTSNWGKGFGNIMDNVAQAPDGTLTADKWVEDTTLAFHTLSQSTSFVSGRQYTYSIYAKAGERPAIQLILPSGAFTTQAFAFFDLTTGTLGSSQNVSATSITHVGYGWYRCSITQTATATATASVQNAIGFGPAGAANFYTGNGTAGIFIWGAQLELGGTPSVYADAPLNVAVPVYANSPPVCLGLVESTGKTNLVIQSSDFNTTWVNSGLAATPVVVDSAISPDGTQNADKLVEASGGTFHLVRQDIAVTANTVYTFSVWLKPVDRIFARVQYTETTESSGAFVDVNISNGTSSAVSAIGTASNAFSSVVSYPNGWYRVILSCIIDAASVTGRVQVLLAAGSGTVNYAGNGVSGFYIWGAQLEQHPTATNYIPTTTVSVARTSEFNSTVSTGLVDSAKGTAMFVGDFYNGAGRDQVRKHVVSMGTTLSSVLYALPAGGQVHTSAVNDGTTESGGGFNFTPTNFVQTKLGCIYGSGTMVSYYNGSNTNGAAAFDGVMNDGGTISFGVRSDNTGHVFGHVYSADYHNFKYPVATLSRITK